MTNLSIAIISVIVNIWLQSEATRINKQHFGKSDGFPGDDHHWKPFRRFRYMADRNNLFDFSLN